MPQIKNDGEPSLDGYAHLMGLGHSPERLAELQPYVEWLLQEARRLWSVPIDSRDMAIDFDVMRNWRSETRGEW